MRPKKDDHPPRARSSSSGGIRPRCRSSISVQPSSGSVRTTVTNSYSPRPPERLQDGARHQDAVFADRKGDVHDLVFFFLGIRHAFDRQVLEPDDGGELTAEYRLVEAERLLGVTGEIQVRVQRGRPLPPTRASAPSYALFSSAIEFDVAISGTSRAGSCSRPSVTSPSAGRQTGRRPAQGEGSKSWYASSPPLAVGGRRRSLRSPGWSQAPASRQRHQSFLPARGRGAPLALRPSARGAAS
jgi:hypothetical protein